MKKTKCSIEQEVLPYPNQLEPVFELELVEVVASAEVPIAQTYKSAVQVGAVRVAPSASVAEKLVAARHVEQRLVAVELLQL